MTVKTVEQVFGTGAQRLASGATTPSAGLFIPDSALISAGLATPSTATAERHLVAVIINAKSALTQTGFDADTDQKVYVSTGFASFVNRGTNNDSYRLDQLTFNLAQLDQLSTIDPDNY
jgi:hypothetical protein